MNEFNGSKAGISCFTHSCVAFSYGESLQKAGRLDSAELHSKNSRDPSHWFLAGCDKADPSSHMLKKVTNEIFTENKI